MKKLICFGMFFILTCSLLLSSCSSDIDELQLQENNNEFAAPFSRSVDEAIGIAQKHMDYLYPVTESRRPRTIDRANIKTIKSAASRNGDTEDLIYAINYDDNQGYVLVSVPRAADEILAVVPKGNFDPENPGDNPGLNLFIDMAKDYAADAARAPKDPNIAYPRDSVAIALFRNMTDSHPYHCDPQLSLVWGQSGIYGRFCPNGIAGCTPLAIGTVIIQQNYKAVANKTMYYNYSGADINSEYVEWIELYRHKYSYSYEGGKFNGDHLCYAADKVAVHKTIGRILRQIGKDADTDYSDPRFSLTYSNKIKPTLKKYTAPGMIISDLKDYNHRYIPKYIDNGLIVMSAGTVPSETNPNGIGHTWVADGYDFYDVNGEYRTHDIETDEFSNWMPYHQRTISIHMRWGWSGQDDGYYSGDVFRVNSDYYDRYVRFVASTTCKIN